MTTPGWYNDEQDPARARWHDGERWTPHTVAKADWEGRGMPPPPREPQRAFPRADAPRPAPRRAGPPARSWKVPAIVALVAAVGLGAWYFTRDDSTGGVPGSGTTYATPKAVAAALTAAGLPCDDYEDMSLEESEEEMSFGPETRSAAGTCDLDGDSVSIDMFEDAAHQRQYMSLGRTMGCAFAEGFGITEFNFAVGKLWVVSLEDQLDVEQIQKVATALDGDHQSIDC